MPLEGGDAAAGRSSPRMPARISKAQISEPSLNPPQEVTNMPEKEELDRLFRQLMESMNVSPEHEQDLLAMSDERKWNLIRKNAQKKEALPPDYFCDQLRRHLDPDLRKKRVKKEKLKGLEPTFSLLKKLEVALRTNHAGWTEEFCDHPNTGHLLLVQFLEALPAMLESKATAPALMKEEEEHHLCVLCVKALMKHDYGFRKVVQEAGFLYRIVRCFTSTNPRTRVAVMQIMAVVANNPSGGAVRAVEAFHHLSLHLGDTAHFASVVDRLREDSMDEDLSTACMTCFLSMINNAPDLNMLVYVQTDLEQAGIADVLPALENHYSNRVRGLVEEYANKMLNVDSIVSSRDEQRELYLQASDQVKALQATLDDVTKQRDELRQLHKEAQIKASDLQDRLKLSRREAEQLTESMERMQAEMQKQSQLIADQERQIKEVEEHAMRTAEQLRQQQRLFKRQSFRVGERTGGKPEPESGDKDGAAAGTEDSTAAGGTIPPPPPAPPLPNGIPAPPPPPPPPMGPDGATGLPPPPPPPLMSYSYAPPGMKPKPRITPNVALPMLNWVPLRNVTGTIFEELDDQPIIEAFDFAEFEQEFKVKAVTKVLDQAKIQNKRKKERVTVLEPNRAQNLVITVRRIGLDYEDLRQTILSTDISMLPAEHAELLLNYIPDDEEVAALEKHKHQKERFAEAERFMFEMLSVDRYESRLRVMAYIGYFDELVLTVVPQMEAVISASECLINSASFRKLLEIILAFGNYMNSAKRGSAYGFKLATFDRLLDTKSHDRKQTLLHYLVHTVEDRFPQVERFLDELASLPDAARVSLVTLTSDVQGLRKGIDLILYEREKQQNNYIIYSFYANAVNKVGRITERYKVMVESYRSVCELYNENPEKLEPFEFFSVFAKFTENYMKAKEDNRRRQATRAAKQQQRGVDAAPGVHPEGSLVPVQHIRNDDIALPSHPVLNINSKRL
ncbi:hypothetical protein PTSG_02093 [Salpingoeca rosetta]|uniref:FH2 domain-containing protein n=1 Tax=Salpingoeca rosetta (strain ATCC 50818 / BSB-021) TaxID=946362 RepID=F2U2L9_SALR5|nr:uncharacterized protein PTSG_02093 [Salpingoeca rosetta]EGD81374.1 hypothetical protein PTSG_02093 [Salpingoeca rosetta]|eukprot:XP_004996578.1 hypothetical protein PTSG_02093 [Salpingoeca rosetta]